jgi:hypothetical protein
LGGLAVPLPQRGIVMDRLAFARFGWGFPLHKYSGLARQLAAE